MRVRYWCTANPRHSWVRFAPHSLTDTRPCIFCGAEARS